MFKIAAFISLFAVALVLVEKKNQINENKVLTIKKEAPKVAFLCSLKQTNNCFE